MKRRALLAAVAFVVMPATVPAQATGKAPMKTKSAARKIAEAVQAAPRSVTDKATVMDWPTPGGGEPATLREGSNGWICFPDMPETEGFDPACADAPWQQWGEAWSAHEEPHVKTTGVMYMLAGGSAGSNTDPFATEKTADNQWGMDPPHIMIVVPDASALEGLPTTRDSGRPWVMYAGTPYAHLMIPVPRK